MLAHSFDRFYVVTKFILPSIGDLNLSKLNYDNTYVYLDIKKCLQHWFKETYVRSHDILQKDWTFCTLLQKTDKSHITTQLITSWKMRSI